MRGTIIRISRTNEPGEDRMSSAATAYGDLEQSKKIVEILERIERGRTGTLDLARPRIADKLGVTTGTLETLRRGRLKNIGGWLRDRIASLLMREIGAEITRLRNELDLAFQSGSDPRWHNLAQIKADLAALEALMASRAPSPEGGL